jgi:hypothetical protein
LSSRARNAAGRERPQISSKTFALLMPIGTSHGALHDRFRLAWNNFAP